DVFVPTAHTGPARFEPRRSGNPLFRARTELVGHAAHPLGVARHAIDAFKELAIAKTFGPQRTPFPERPIVQTQIAEAEALVGSGRAFLRETVGLVWKRLCADEEPSAEERARVRLAMSYATRNAVAAVDLMYTGAGASAIYTSHPIERC